VRTGSDRAGLVLLSCRWDGLCWSDGCWQGAEPLPADEEGILPGPAGADFQDALAGVMGQAGGEVPDPVNRTERIRVGVPQVLVIVAAEQTRPGREIGGDVAAMTQPQLTCQHFDGSPRSPMAFAVRTPPVSTTACSRWTTSMYWG
jgi:hypothetical protein